jgi:hypothetical protein
LVWLRLRNQQDSLVQRGPPGSSGVRDPRFPYCSGPLDRGLLPRSQVLAQRSLAFSDQALDDVDIRCATRARSIGTRTRIEPHALVKPVMKTSDFVPDMLAREWSTKTARTNPRSACAGYAGMRAAIENCPNEANVNLPKWVSSHVTPDRLMGWVASPRAAKKYRHT